MPRRINFLDWVLILLPVALLLQIPVDPGWAQRLGASQQFVPWRVAVLAGLGLGFVAIWLGIFVISARTGALISKHIPRNIRLSAQGSWELGGMLVIVALQVTQNSFSAGPQAIGLLGFVLLGYLLWQYLLGRRHSLWILLPLFVVWANLGSGIVVGLAQIALTLVLLVIARFQPAFRRTFPFQLIPLPDVALKIRRLALVLCGSLLCTLINPSTYQLYGDLRLATLDPTHLVSLRLGLTAAGIVPWLVLFMLPCVYCALASRRIVRWFFDSVVDFYFGIHLGDWLYYFYNAALVFMSIGIFIFRLIMWVNASNIADILRQAP